MNTSTWHVEKIVPILISGGFFVHLVNASRQYLVGPSSVAEILLWPVDFVLGALMAFCAVVLILRRRQFADTFEMTSTPRRIGYWAITFYIAVSVPGHVLFLTTGTTAYFDVFPPWFSLVIMPVYLAIIAYFLTLRPRADSPAQSLVPGGEVIR